MYFVGIFPLKLLNSLLYKCHYPSFQLDEVAALEIIALLLDEATDDSVEVAVGFLKECGKKLTEVVPRAVQGVFDTLRKILHDGKISTRVQYSIEVLSHVRKDGFKVWIDFQAVPLMHDP